MAQRTWMEGLTFRRWPLALAAMTAAMLFAAVMTQHLLLSYPPGLDPDAAGYGLNALKPLRYGLLPFYDVFNGTAEPLFIYAAAASIQVLGATRLALKLLSTFFGLAGLAMLFACLCELGRGEFDVATRRAIAIVAVAALATSQVMAFLNRFGMRFTTADLFQMAAVWSLARALRTRRPTAWAAAGVLAAATQYTYLSARALPILLGLVLILKLPRRWPPDRALLQALALYAISAAAALVPQLLWFARYPETFFSRTGQVGLVHNPLYPTLGLAGTLLDKFHKYWQALGTVWYGQYNQIKEPLLAPLFFYGFVLGLAVALVHLRKRLPIILLAGLAVMLLPDLLGGDRDWPHETRAIGAYPFAAAIAGLGLGGALGWLRRWPRPQRWAGLALAAGILATAGAQAARFFSMEANLGKMRWGGNVWLRRVDSGVAEMIAGDSRTYLLPLYNYTGTVVKFLTSRRALEVRSAVGSDGQLLPILRSGERLRLFLPREADDAPWQGDPTQWVLFEGNTAYVLPPPLDLAAMLPSMDEGTAVYGRGIDDIVRLGHIGEVAADQLGLQHRYQPEFPQQACFQRGPCLEGVSYSRRQLEPEATLRVYLYWTVRQRVPEDYLLFVHLLDSDQNAITGVDEYPLMHGYRVYEWKPGELIISAHDLRLPASLPPGRYGIELGLYPPHVLARVPTVDDGGQVRDDRVVLWQLKSPRPPVGLPDDYTPAGIAFADEVELIGYRVDAWPAAGGPLRITLWWRGPGPAAQDWTSFFHLAPESDPAELVGQVDRAIGGGAYPPTIWEDGEIVRDQFELQPRVLAPGAYALWMGLYSPLTRERVPVTASPGPARDDRVLLLTFQIQP